MEQIAFPRYEQYKPSGSDWLGDVPETWSVKRIRAVAKLKSNKNQPELQVLSVYREFGVILKDSRDDNHNATSLDTSNYKVVESGDLVINKMKAWQGSMGVSEYAGIVSPAYITCAINLERIYPKFLHYLLRSRPYIGVYNALSYGVRVGQWDMHYEDFKNILLPIPSKAEQQRIANFLDQKTAEIDEAIAKKQRLIELLKEQKAILINQAVTKGLNPKAPMRDSGVEWIGEIPSSWRVLPLTKYLKSIIDYRGKTPTKSDSGTFLVTAKNIKNGFIDYEVSKEYVAGSDYQKIMARGQPKINDILFTTEAPLGSVALVDREDIALAQRVIKFRVNELELEPEFAKISLSASYFQNYLLMLATGSTALGIKSSKLHQLKIIVPPIKDQKEIVKFSNDKINQFDLVIFLNQRGIEYLQELKCILISNAVTGKIKL